MGVPLALLLLELRLQLTNLLFVVGASILEEPLLLRLRLLGVHVVPLALLFRLGEVLAQ